MFESGQQVLVTGGAFEGLFGILVVSANSGGGTCRVRLELWGQDVTVELPPGWLGMVEDADEPFVRFDDTPV